LRADRVHVKVRNLNEPFLKLQIMKKPAEKIERERPRPKKRARKFRVSVIGAGRMGTALGRALQGLGHEIELVVTKHSASARRAAKIFKCETSTLSRLRLKRPELDRLFCSDFLLIATPDDALETVTRQLETILRKRAASDIRTLKEPRRIALHTSGALSSSILKPLRAAGYEVGSLHPLISVADAGSDGKVFQGVHFCIEGDREAVRAAKSIVSDLDGNSFTIKANSKALYHAAAVMSSGHVTALFDLAVEMLSNCGLSERRAKQVLLPLLQSATENLVSKDSARALTGPFARGDVKTAAMHLAALKSAHADAALQAYVALALRSLDLAKTLRPDSKSIDQMSRLLSRARK
jgi:predicted short-subunit dehydrogenase-like oxidoreductase (DUF2520 family)